MVSPGKSEIDSLTGILLSDIVNGMYQRRKNVKETEKDAVAG